MTASEPPMIASGRVNVHSRSKMRLPRRVSLRVDYHSWALVLLILAFAASRLLSKARDIGIPFDGNPGNLNAITDVRGVTVGHSTIVKGQGRLKVGKGPVRTGRYGHLSVGNRQL